MTGEQKQTTEAAQERVIKDTKGNPYSITDPDVLRMMEGIEASLTPFLSGVGNIIATSEPLELSDTEDDEGGDDCA